jgi:hypothetical protein
LEKKSLNWFKMHCMKNRINWNLEVTLKYSKSITI